MTDAQRQRIRQIVSNAVEQLLEVLEEMPAPRKSTPRRRRARTKDDAGLLDRVAVERLARRKGVSLGS